MCAELSLDEVLWSARLRPNQKLLAFHHSSDPDGFKPDLSGSQRTTSEMLQLKLRTTPGNGLFEVSMSHNLVTGDFSIRVRHASHVVLCLTTTCLLSLVSYVPFCDFPHRFKMLVA